MNPNLEQIIKNNLAKVNNRPQAQQPGAAIGNVFDAVSPDVNAHPFDEDIRQRSIQAITRTAELMMVLEPVLTQILYDGAEQPFRDPEHLKIFLSWLSKNFKDKDSFREFQRLHSMVIKNG